MWLLDPGTHLRGNIAFGLGVKAPTGSNHVASQFYSANNAPVTFEANQAVQPGDGGWGIILQTQAFRQLFERGFGVGLVAGRVTATRPVASAVTRWVRGLPFAGVICTSTASPSMGRPARVRR